MTVSAHNPPSPDIQRLRVEIRGAVQGVGFRPFVYRVAKELELAGWVINDSRGVIVEVEGRRRILEEFLVRIHHQYPPRAVVHSIEFDWLEAEGIDEFTIRHSKETGTKSVVMLPDVATCDDCLSEVLSPDNRRFGYPFTNCTNCGPRFTIIRGLPYDRFNTTMQGFEMCRDCYQEYEEPLDRRFHAQPNACPVCGPQLELWTPDSEVPARGGAALRGAAESVVAGQILALKGLGGFHLMVDARDPEAVDRLRQRKARYEKPLALMVRDVQQARQICEVSAAAEALLSSAEAPIVLMDRLTDAPVARQVADGNPRLGLMLPYTPLHHLLMAELDFPVVATSGNLSDEPICIGNQEALDRLGLIADLFLVHDRPIQRHVDDSVLHLIRDQPQPIRRARGLAPMPLLLVKEAPTILAVGGHLKNVIALSVGDRAFLSQHIGDMETPQAYAAFEAVIRDFLEVYEARPVAVAHDLHPDYTSTQWAQEWVQDKAGVETVPVQHHHAHLVSCLTEHAVEGPALGVTWDGTGYGTDGTIWGGEFLLGSATGFRRVARLRPFLLPGGDAAVKEPCRIALALLWGMWGKAALEHEDLAPIRALEPSERSLLASMLIKRFNTPTTTSAGRLFDGVAALLGIEQQVSFEGQAAMALEFASGKGHNDAYPIEAKQVATDDGELLELDWQPMLEAIIDDLAHGVVVDVIGERFHNTLAKGITIVAEAVGKPRVVLSGGCFQNQLLTEKTLQSLEMKGFEVLIHRRVPANDGGISLGQIAIAAAELHGDDEATARG